MSNRPSNEEYSPFAESYVKLVPEGDIQQILNGSLADTTGLFSSLTEDQAAYRYAPGKWSLKQVLGHIADNERIMSYRLLRIARGDQTPLAGYDENQLMSGATFDDLPLAVIVEDYAAARRSTLALLRGLSEEAWTRIGIVNDRKSSARAWAYIIAGHEIHHLNVVKERYLS
ncbi:DinB family protein [Cohnella yongneupensis]|uniref:DinB family protein n=1 Tax=Cohnella yongneupensis TaxID=425006 RepID=A0ABW0R361_9BACL